MNMSRQDSLLRVFKLNVLENIDENLIIKAFKLCMQPLWNLCLESDCPSRLSKILKKDISVLASLVLDTTKASKWCFYANNFCVS